jgi:hypothetical protein
MHFGVLKNIFAMNSIFKVIVQGFFQLSKTSIQPTTSTFWTRNFKDWLMAAL